MDLVWTDVAATTKFGGEPATLSTFQAPRSNAEISGKKFHTGVSQIVGCSGLFAGLAQGFIWALGSGSGQERVS
jgi:hypothetical protein